MPDQDPIIAARVAHALDAHRTRQWVLTPLKGKVPVTRGWNSVPPPTADTVRRWAEAGNVGLRCGSISGVVVLDVDPGRGGKEPDDLPPGPVVVTGSGGLHLYFAYPEDGLPVPQSKDRLAAGLEVKSDGGQVVFVGSIHPDTERPYEWREGTGALPLPPLPPAMLRRIREGAGESPAPTPTAVPPVADERKVARARAYLAKVPLAVSGQHGHDQTFKAACSIVEGFDLDEETAYALLSEWNQGCQPPWSEKELRHKIKDADKKAKRRGYLLEDAPATKKPRTSRNAPVAARQGGAPPAADLPEVRVTTDMESVVDEAEAALLRENRGLYQRGGVLVHVARDGAPGTPLINRPPEAPTIAVAGPAFVRERFSASARWLKYDARKRDWAPAIPPTWAVSSFLERAHWRLPRLEAVIEWPTLRLDGSVLQTPGYDEGTGILFEPNRGADVEIPGSPTREEAAKAAQILGDPFAEFPFKSAEDRVAVLAAILTVVARHAIDGPVPMFSVRSTVRGSGKTLLVRGISALVTGRDAALNAYSRDDDETRKVVLAICLEGHPIAVFDNVEGEMGSPALAQILTSGSISGRVLGESRNVRLRSLGVWFATGNNIAFASDLGRRVVPIDFEPDTENPEDRTGFRNPDLLAYVAKERPRLLGAALTILRAHAVAGRPANGLPRLGSYEAWDDVVRGALVWCGAGDPCQTRLRLREEGDADRDRLRTLTKAWRATFGDEAVTVSYAIERSRHAPELGEALAATGRDKDGKPNAVRIGNYLRFHKGRLAEGLKFVPDGHDRNGIHRWRCAGAAGVAGAVLPLAREVSEAGTDKKHRQLPTAPADPAPPAPGREPGDDDDGDMTFGARGGSLHQPSGGHEWEEGVG